MLSWAFNMSIEFICVLSIRLSVPFSLVFVIHILFKEEYPFAVSVFGFGTLGMSMVAFITQMKTTDQELDEQKYTESKKSSKMSYLFGRDDDVQMHLDAMAYIRRKKEEKFPIPGISGFRSAILFDAMILFLFVYLLQDKLGKIVGGSADDVIESVQTWSKFHASIVATILTKPVLTLTTFFLIGQFTDCILYLTSRFLNIPNSSVANRSTIPLVEIVWLVLFIEWTAISKTRKNTESNMKVILFVGCIHSISVCLMRLRMELHEKVMVPDMRIDWRRFLPFFAVLVGVALLPVAVVSDNVPGSTLAEKIQVIGVSVLATQLVVLILETVVFVLKPAYLKHTKIIGTAILLLSVMIHCAYRSNTTKYVGTKQMKLFCSVFFRLPIFFSAAHISNEFIIIIRFLKRYFM